MNFNIYELYPFSTREMNKLEEKLFIPEITELKKKTPLERISINKLYERIITGSYPELYRKNKIETETFYKNYISTYIERDLRKLINVKDEIKFTKFISSLASRTGQEFNANKIAMEIEIDNKKINEWTSILKNTGIIYLLQPYNNNSLGRAIKHPKIYFMDTGLACYLAGYIDPITLEKST